jgi:AcrR family transcriptional regulator
VTRQRISDQATRLFEAHGFEAVTLAEIAAASDVSVKTVINHFGAKEELFFDAEPAVLSHLVATVTGRAEHMATAALRPLILDGPVLAGPCRWSAVDPELWGAVRAFAECERNSPALIARRAAILQSWLEPLAAATGSVPWAALVVGVLTLRHRVVQDGLTAGLAPATVRKHVGTDVAAALDAVGRAFGRAP